VKCGERVLLPAVRQAPPETLIITNGFSCHQQMLQLAGRKALHLAEVLQMALREGTVPAPELREAPPALRNGELRRKRLRRWALAGTGAAAAGIAAILLHKRKGL